ALHEVVGLEPVDAADDLPNLVLVLGERVGQGAIAGVGADTRVHGHLLRSTPTPRVAPSHSRGAKVTRRVVTEAQPISRATGTPMRPIVRRCRKCDRSASRSERCVTSRTPCCSALRCTSLAIWA